MAKQHPTFTEPHGWPAGPDDHVRVYIADSIVAGYLFIPAADYVDGDDVHTHTMLPDKCVRWRRDGVHMLEPERLHSCPRYTYRGRIPLADCPDVKET